MKLTDYPVRKIMAIKLLAQDLAKAKVARIVGVSTRVIFMWLGDEDFKQHIIEERKIYLKEVLGDFIKIQAAAQMGEINIDDFRLPEVSPIKMPEIDFEDLEKALAENVMKGE